MRPLRSELEIDASILTDAELPRGARYVVANVDGMSIALLFLDLTYLPGNAMRELGLTPKTMMVLWTNPPNAGAQKLSTFVSPSHTVIRLPRVRKELGCSLDHALAVCEIIGYVMDMPVEGAVSAE